MDKAKTEGQVFTPPEIVSMILDSVGYDGEKILTKSIMEPSFGNGAFLTEIVSRIIKQGALYGKSKEAISEIIQTNIHGFEKDEALYREAIEKLDNQLSENGVPQVSWDNLKCGDALFLYEDYIGKMDCCVGNPPYVRIVNIPKEYREAVRGFNFANGTIDLYVVFYEIGIKMLKKGSGKLAYITPNAFLKNNSQQKFRDYLIDNGLLAAVYDFKSSKIFSAGTYSCICVIDRNADTMSNGIIRYREYNMYKAVVKSHFRYPYFKAMFRGKAWNLGSEQDVYYLKQNADLMFKIKDIATVQNGIVTNKDGVYIGRAWLNEACMIPYFGKHTDARKLVWFNGHQVESDILHRCLKASAFNGKLSNNYILYPYKNAAGHPIPGKSNSSEAEASYAVYEEQELKKSFPCAYEYLMEHREQLAERDADTSAAWFAFGRSQGIANSGYKKLVFSRIVSKSACNAAVYVVPEDVIVYGGLYITAGIPDVIDSTQNVLLKGESYDNQIENISRILQSKDFHRYCTLVGKDMSGGYVFVSGSLIKNYGIPEQIEKAC